jgi:hypothetical protein
VAWRYSAVLLMALDEMVVSQQDQVVWPMVKMDMKVG